LKGRAFNGQLVRTMPPGRLFLDYLSYQVETSELSLSRVIAHESGNRQTITLPVILRFESLLKLLLQALPV